MQRHVWNELARIEQQTLARGPRTRTGLGGVFDDLSGGAPLPDWAQRAMEGAGLAIVVGGLTRWKSGSWKTAAKVGAGVGAVYGVGVLAYTVYYQSRATDQEAARFAAEVPASFANGGYSCPGGGTVTRVTGDRYGDRMICR